MGITSLQQTALDLVIPLERSNQPAVGELEERGAVFTRQEVVEFILDLAGYTADRPLHRMRLLEPCFGQGDFLVPALERLLAAYSISGKSNPVEELRDAICAVEIHAKSIAVARRRLSRVLLDHGIHETAAVALLDSWFIEGDFLLVDLPGDFTHVIGNPPYVRHEAIPDSLLVQYRSRYKTMYGRADLYVPFIERSLMSLGQAGTLGFICSDRWMKNKYGGPLRGMVSQDYHLKFCIDMVDTPAFNSDVTAYPAITVIQRTKPGPTRIAYRPAVTRPSLSRLAAALTEPGLSSNDLVTQQHVVNGMEPWILDSFESLAVVRRLEQAFPLLEETGCKVGIGVASGADRVFIGCFEGLPVEQDRLIPLVKNSDVAGGTINWQGLAIINPFHEDGSLVDLGVYPHLRMYFEKHAHILKKRYIAKRNPTHWYRTIDRIYPELTKKAKLLIPDINGEATIVYEGGQYYPHHNMYYITADEWDLRALQTVLRSGIAKLFVATYSTEMRGGYLRFQAQYLRRIRIPRWDAVPKPIQTKLIAASTEDDIASGIEATWDLYNLTANERAILGGYLDHGA